MEGNRLIFFCEDCVMRRVRDARRDSYECGWDGHPVHWYERSCNCYDPVAEPITKPIIEDDVEEMLPGRWLRCFRCQHYTTPLINGSKIVPRKGQCLFCTSGNKFKLKK